MRKSKVDVLIIQWVEEGKLYIWSSAGSIVTGPTIELTKSLDDPKDAPDLSIYEWLGLVPYIILPHSDNEKYGEKITKILKEYSADTYSLITIKDTQGVFIQGNHMSFVENSEG